MTTTTEQTTTALHIQIMEIVCDCCLVKIEELQAPQKISRQCCDARHIAMTLIYKYCDTGENKHTKTKIGLLFGGRDHTTVISAMRKAQDLIDTNKDFRRMFNCSETVIKYLLEDNNEAS